MDFIESWQEEKRSAYIYKIIAEVEVNPVHQKLFLALSEMAEQQAIIWEDKIKQKGQKPPPFIPKRRTRMIIWLLRRLGAKPLRLALAAMKIRGMSVYNLQDVQLNSFQKPPEIESKHKRIQYAGNLRAAIFGVSDGLLSNASLIYGIAGANVGQNLIVLSGIAGLLAGAFSMGSGEYISVRSQRQMLEYQLKLEQKELELYPEEEAQELALIYESRGLPKVEAKRLADLLIQNPDKALETLAREELGLNPDELGSPWGAAISSFISFAIGAIIPLLPFIFSTSHANLVISIGLTGLAFFLVGAALNLFIERNILFGGIRLVLIGAAVGSLTYLIGKLFGVTVG